LPTAAETIFISPDKMHIESEKQRIQRRDDIGRLCENCQRRQCWLLYFCYLVLSNITNTH